MMNESAHTVVAAAIEPGDVLQIGFSRFEVAEVEGCGNCQSGKVTLVSTEGNRRQVALTHRVTRWSEAVGDEEE